MPEGSLPELARSLRSLGALGTLCMQEAHEAVFGPLLEARTVAARATLDDAIIAMNGNAILRRIETAVVSAATRGVSGAPRARALTARAQEATESLRRSLLALDELAATAGSDEGWDQWVEQLRQVFVRADEACRSLASVLDDRDVKDPSPRWYVRHDR
jgi:hypothetical protein